MAVDTTMRRQALAGRLANGGKYLAFNLGHEGYGIEILKVQEIIGMLSVTRVPKTPEFVRGVVNLRGKVIPMVMGLIVDAVSEVLASGDFAVPQKVKNEIEGRV